MKKKTKLISLDLSTTKSGIAYFENGKYIESFVIDFEKIDDIDERTEQMGKSILGALNHYKPDIVYTEDSFKGKNPKVLKCLSRLHGMAQGWCLTNNANHTLVYPSSWRKYIPGFPNGRSVKRAEQKAYSIQYVTEHYGFVPITDDQADAILIGEGMMRKFG